MNTEMGERKITGICLKNWLKSLGDIWRNFPLLRLSFSFILYKHQRTHPTPSPGSPSPPPCSFTFLEVQLQLAKETLLISLPQVRSLGKPSPALTRSLLDCAT